MPPCKARSQNLNYTVKYEFWKMISQVGTLCCVTVCKGNAGSISVWRNYLFWGGIKIDLNK